MSNVVCVAADHKYDDSMGAYVVAYLWDGERVFKEGGIYQDTDYTSANATLEEKRAASIWLEQNTKESRNYNKYARCNTYIGCIVTLKRSRKAPNKKPLKVLAFNDRYYSNQFRAWINETVCILDEETGVEYTVSYGCISELIKGVQKFPYWYVSEREYNESVTVFEENKAEEQVKSTKKQLHDLAMYCAINCIDGFNVETFKETLNAENQRSIDDLIDRLLRLISKNI